LAIATDWNRIRQSAEPRASWSLFRQGAFSALTNPKGLLFFAAFLPQFIDPARSLFLQFVIMAGTFGAIEIATEVFIASMAHRISPWLRRVGRRFNQACGGVFPWRLASRYRLRLSYRGLLPENVTAMTIHLDHTIVRHAQGCVGELLASFPASPGRSQDRGHSLRSTSMMV
jgi:hypothetical protein